MNSASTIRRFRAASACRAGFTLLELLVVIAIIAVLAALIQTAYQRSLQIAYATACTSNLRQIGVALNAYLVENDMTLPPLQNRAKITDDMPALDTVLNKYSPNLTIFACPADNEKLFQTSGTSYYWNTALNNQRITALSFLNLTELQSRIPVVADKDGFHPNLGSNKVNILYADGHATNELKFWDSTDPPAN